MNKKGFTLIELIIVVSMIIIISGIIMTNLSRCNTNISIFNTELEVYYRSCSVDDGIGYIVTSNGIYRDECNACGNMKANNKYLITIIQYNSTITNYRLLEQ